MKSSLVGRRYARALLDLADQAKQTERVAKDLADFSDSFEKSRELRTVFENPQVARATRQQVLTAVLDRMAVSPIVKSVLLMLADRGRLKHIGEVAAAFEQLAEQRAGKVRAEVTSAGPLDEAYYIELQKALEAATGKKVVVVKKEDPSLIAGVVTRVGDRVFDGSVRSKLRELSEELLSN
jgi:F-type H+-transporting ATPase subunit delta